MTITASECVTGWKSGPYVLWASRGCDCVEPFPAAVAFGVADAMAAWATTLYGFVEFDSIHDSTQPGLTTINDSQGNAALPRPGS